MQKKCFLRLLLNQFSYIKDPKHVILPPTLENENYPNKKINRTECPRETGIQDRNLQS